MFYLFGDKNDDGLFAVISSNRSLLVLMKESDELTMKHYIIDEKGKCCFDNGIQVIDESVGSLCTPPYTLFVTDASNQSSPFMLFVDRLKISQYSNELTLGKVDHYVTNGHGQKLNEAHYDSQPSNGQ